MYSCSCCCCCCCSCSVHILRLFQTLITPSILHQILTSRPFLELAGSWASNGVNCFWKFCLKGVQKWIFPSLLKCKNQEIWMVHTEVVTRERVSVHNSALSQCPGLRPSPARGLQVLAGLGPQSQCVAEGHHQPSAGAGSRQHEAAVPSSTLYYT